MGLYRTYIGLGNQAIQLPFECTTDLPYYIPLITHDVKKLRLPCFEPETTSLSFSSQRIRRKIKKTRAEQMMIYFYIYLCVRMNLDNVNTMNNSSNSSD